MKRLAFLTLALKGTLSGWQIIHWWWRTRKFRH